MAVLTAISSCIIVYVRYQDDLFHNLPDPRATEAILPGGEDEANKLSKDEAAGHYRGSAILSSDSGYSVDLAAKQYGFNNSESDVHQRLLHSGASDDN